jgi:molecular chaperone DnaK (HSP70)
MAKREQDELFLGIDFGTSKTCVAYCTSDKDDVSIFEDGNLQSRFPTIVGRAGGADREWIIGQEARYDASGGKAVDDIKMHIESSAVTPLEFTNVELAGKFLSEIKNKFRERLNNPAIAGVTITIPARWSIAKRQATLFAAKLAGFDCPVALLEEPLAAFLRFYKRNRAILKQHENVLVVDFGGGTCDLSLIQFADGKPRVQTSDTIHIGGGDIDAAIVRFWLNRYQNEQLVSPRSISEMPSIFQKLRFEAETSKKRLCKKVQAESIDRTREQLALAEIVDNGRFVNLSEYINLSRNLSAQELKDIVEEHIIGTNKRDDLIPGKIAEKLLNFLNENDQGRTVTCVIFSGGTCRVWAIQDYLRKFLHRRYGEKIFFLPSEVEEEMMDQSVAVGAALHQYFASQKNPIAIPTLIQKLKVTISFDGKTSGEVFFEEGENLPTSLKQERVDYVPFAQNKPVEILVEQLVNNQYQFVSKSKPFIPDEKMTPLGIVWWLCGVNEYGLVDLKYGLVDVAWGQWGKTISLYPAIDNFNVSDKQRIHDTQTALGIYKEQL